MNSESVSPHPEPTFFIVLAVLSCLMVGAFLKSSGKSPSRFLMAFVVACIVVPLAGVFFKNGAQSSPQRKSSLSDTERVVGGGYLWDSPQETDSLIANRYASKVEAAESLAREICATSKEQAGGAPQSIWIDFAQHIDPKVQTAFEQTLRNAAPHLSLDDKKTSEATHRITIATRVSPPDDSRRRRRNNSEEGIQLVATWSRDGGEEKTLWRTVLEKSWVESESAFRERDDALKRYVIVRSQWPSHGKSRDDVITQILLPEVRRTLPRITPHFSGYVKNPRLMKRLARSLGERLTTDRFSQTFQLDYRGKHVNNLTRECCLLDLTSEHVEYELDRVLISTYGTRRYPSHRIHGAELVGYSFASAGLLGVVGLVSWGFDRRRKRIDT